MTTPDIARRMRTYCLTIVLLVAALIVTSWVANAQAPAGSSLPNNPANTGLNTSGAPASTETLKPLAVATPFPLSVKRVKVNGESAGLRDKITVLVANLEKELKRQQEVGSPAIERLDPYKFVLFLNGIEMKQLYPETVIPVIVPPDAPGGPLDPVAGDTELQFELRRDTQTSAAWLNFLAKPATSNMMVSAGVGLEGKTPYAGKPFILRLYNQKLLYVGTALFILALLGFIVAARMTTIIRDSGPPKPVNGALTRPYSLGRAQMAWWFFIILGSFLFIALVTWDLDTITSSSLVLLGIGTGTALGAAMVDANKRQNSDSELHTLGPQEVKLTALTTELNSQIQDAQNKLTDDPNQPDLAASLAAWRTEWAMRDEERRRVKLQLDDALSAQQKPESEGMITDFLSDVNGLTFHRFQIVVWTITLGLIFIYSVWSNLAMPQFSDTILALMGISAGTYIGFKIPEKQTKAEL